MKIAIIGSRNCSDIDILSYLDCMPTEIISSGAKGVDTYAREFAMTHNLPLTEFLPEYEKYGRCAPLYRNRQIVEHCDSLIAFGMANPAEQKMLSTMPADWESRYGWYT